MYKIPDAPICERANDLMAFLYGELDESVVRDFERHLLNCAHCESEFSAFKQIRSSVAAWRQESLGGATAPSVSTSPAVVRVSDLGKPSAIAAIRELFALSPLWMKGSIAFASILLCVLSVLGLARLFDNPNPVVVTDEKRYTEKELQSRIEDAVKSRLEGREAPKSYVEDNDEKQFKTQRKGTNRSSERIAANPKVGRGPLTKSEREQLAADLRLITQQDDTDLDLLGDGNN